MSVAPSSRTALPTFARTSSLVSAPILFGALFAFGLALIAVTPIPAMSDYPNHLARMYLLAADRAGHPSPFYEVKWAFYPDLAMDLIVPPLGRFIGVELAGRLFVLLAQFLVVSGAVAIEWAVKKRFDFAGFVALLFFCSFSFAWGFVNFQFGLGVALWGIAVWISLRERSGLLRFVVHIAFFVALLVAHLLTLGIYGFALGVYECWRAYRNRPSFALFARDALLLAAPAIVGAAVFFAVGGSVGEQGDYWGLTQKYLWPFMAIDGYSNLLSASLCALSMILLWRLARAGALRFENAGAWMAAGFLALYLAMPQILRHTFFVDIRIVVAAALILPGFLSVHFPNERWRRRSSLLFLAMIVANFALMATVWTRYRTDHREIIASFSLLPKESKILVATKEKRGHESASLLPMYHMPVLATHYADALVSTTMAAKGKEPLIFRPSFERFSTRDQSAAPISELKAVAVDGAKAQIGDEHLRHWTRDFDYIYYIGQPIANPLPNLLDQIESRRRFTLYRIRKP